MIKNAVLHPIGEQPLLADLFERPQASDVSLLCTNLRMIDGKRPTSIDHPASLFIIPMATIRFIEVPREATEEFVPAESHAASGNGHSAPLASPETGLVSLPGGDLHGLLPEEDPAEDTDEDLLRRIRDL